MITLVPARGTMKPPMGGVICNPDHPFSRGAVLTAVLNETNCKGGQTGIFNILVGGNAKPRLGVMGNGATDPVWGSNRGGSCLVFSDIFHTADLGSAAGFPTTGVTVCIIRRKTDTTARNSHLFNLGTLGATSLINIHAPYGDGVTYWDFGTTAGAGRLSIAGLSFHTRLESWVFTAGPRGSSIWRDGVKIASQSTAVTRSLATGNAFLGNSSAFTAADFQEINTLHTVDYQWPDELCRWWSAEPYAHLYTPRAAPRIMALGGPYSPLPFLIINGVEVTNFDKHTFELTKTSGRQARCNFRIPPNGPVSRPDLDLEVICTEDGTDRLFGGLVDDTDEVGAGRTTRKWDVSGGSYMKYLARRTNVTEDRPEETLYDRIEYLRSTYLDVFSVTLDPGQVTGPTLPAQTYDSMVLQDVFNDITQQSGGYAGTISDYKVLSFKLPTANVAPFDITDATGLAQRDVKVKRTNLVGYGNRVIVKFGRAGQDVTYRFTGDGVTDTFQLGSPISGPLPYTAAGAVGYAIVAYAGNESLGGLSSTTIWLYDPVAKTIFRTLGAPTNGVDFYVTFVTNEQPSAVAENGSAATNPHELTVLRPAISDGVVAQALADALLAVAEVAGLEVEYETWEHGIEPDMTQTIDLSSCGISSTTFTITQVTFKFDGDDRLKRFVRAAAGDIARPELLPQAVYDQWDGIGLSA